MLHRRAVLAARTVLPQLAIVAALAFGPSASRADFSLLDAELTPPWPSVRMAAVAAPLADLSLAGRRVLQARAEDPAAPSAARGAPSGAGALDFDLLPALPAARGPDPELAWRRTMLTWHQGAGIGLVALTLATVVVGQLNYNDRFAGARPSTGKYNPAHSLLATGTLLTFGATGTLALLAPAAPRRDGFDRVTLHKLAMFTAAAGMVAEGALGIWTQQREGYLNQPTVARAHLVLGYVVLTAVTAGVAAIVL